MEKPAVVSSDLTPDWLEKRDRMTSELFHQLRRGVMEPGKGLNLYQLGKFLEHQNPFVTPASKIEEWREFYKDVFGWDKDFSNLQIPPEREGFGWLIIVAEGLTLNRVFDKCTKRMKAWRWADNLDRAVPKNDREAKTDYAIWVRDRVEADEELKNLSANQLTEKGILGITLLERLILELFYFWNTRGKHLDRKNVTLCAGSRRSGGHVPGVHWRSNDRLRVAWGHPVDSAGGLRARAVVSA